jgi:HD-GYP domain-containing protein (c-di-GMP phosphodiesterase class II)
MSASAGSVPDPTVAHGNPDQPAADAAGEGGYSATDLKRAAHALSVRAQAFEAAITLLTDSWAPRGSPEAIAEILLQAVDAGGCCLFEVSPDEGMLVPVLLVGETPRSGGVRVSPDSMPGRVAATGKPLLTDTALVSQGSGQAPEPGPSSSPRSSLCIAVRLPGNGSGVLEMVNKRALSGFNSDDLYTATGMAPALTIALQLKRHWRTRQRDVEELQTLASVGERLAEREDLEGMLGEVTGLAQQVIGAEASSCLLLDETAENLVFKVAHGKCAGVLRHHRVALGEGIAGWVAAEGRMALVADVSADPRFDGRIAQAVGFPVRDLLCVPLKTGHEVLGVLELVNSTRPAGFERRDADLLAAIAGQCASTVSTYLRLDRINRGLIATVECLARGCDNSEGTHQCHPQRVLPVARAVCRQMALSDDQEMVVALTALLHDVGKTGLEKEAHHQPRRLTERERTVVKGHPVVGALFLESLKDSRMKDVVAAVRHHHEWVDGRGYPDGLKGDAIPPASRIIAVVHAYCAMTEGRPYQPARSRHEAIAELRRWSGTQFDADVVEALAAVTEASAPEPALEMSGQTT